MKNLSTVHHTAFEITAMVEITLKLLVY